MKRIWIDLDNSPHVPFFVPIIEELEKRGYSIFKTARDAYQVTELLDLFGLTCKRVGRHYGKQKLKKVMGTGYRALQLVMPAFKEKPALAVSHGSRSQALAAAALRIPSLLILDYEFARGFPILDPTWVMIPEIIPFSAVPFPKERVMRYPGLKEDVYVPRFRPDPSIKGRLGLDDGNLLVTVRPPANEAHYHNPDSEKLFNATIDFLGQNPQVRMVLLPRNDRQGVRIREAWPDLIKSGRITIPDHVVDGLNLLWFSDLAISGGGTMNREAAALGVPVYSIFRGSIGAVDRYLSEAGRLVLLESVEEIGRKIRLRRWERPEFPRESPTSTLSTIVGNIVSALQ